MTDAPKLSTGQSSTLGSYLDNCRACGFEKAATFFERRIAREGRDEIVIADEGQVIGLIAELERTHS